MSIKPLLVPVQSLPESEDFYIRAKDIVALEKQNPASILLGYDGNPITYRWFGGMEDQTRAIMQAGRWYCATIKKGRKRHYVLMKGVNFDRLVELGVVVGAP